MSINVAFIGLGVMGYPMAGHLAKAGFNVCVYNRTQAKAQSWVDEYAGSFATTPREAANNADIVFMCVGNDDDLRAVVYGENGVLAGMAVNSILVDHTTTSAEVAREVAEKAALQNIDFIDAPVSGGQAGAENGVLTVMAGGNEAVFTKVQPVMAAYSRFSQLLGDVGAGQLCKMVNQICIAGVVQGLAEGLHFAKQAGLDGEKVIETISKGAAGSWQMENRYKTMWAGEYEFGFAVDWMRKDLGIALDEAKNNGATLPMTATVDQYYADVQALGGGRYDTSSLLARIEALHKK
ncbi:MULTISPECIES: NAD(P)-dependent oxidoreductase [Pseudoalteromonas]|jgi:2-hydroxy-3-oxopropionate reductase|uniref:2-hydroxy-3-oxopropionate reductase n=1 Tax=Pseudoalteromonas agarivorans DSM 14585 TaxID=1312369 RepID=A0ACA8DVF8_9GAMM|nr:MULTISPECIES: NAD(P)-dependent oxidoreductase [Pseudoalteromonas]MDY6888581.1 NAD(P)-dependent oxidoreductase [Pseudomonadota bacterium]ATC81986.1 2-hydroxy-3-oxopropionate reductase [Pseudoalteromonas agarivorans DSM 14585]KPV97531.1 2-(hydroxymethyl)glutarate dehydrogenase [Pseudoalteromonas sp. P1-11]MCK8106323.1 NAD(P)-dependent oxidoreductase [Pseudoalteromonas sp. 2CM41L]MCK8133262.1 NAD(P)-dependent oxidoreductase [Pseudoalteromonas sp. 2CM28B]|tara:strand:- start:4875 stop:5756 length:882 start_codon:yes stop_codon:yes gene_type:complete